MIAGIGLSKNEDPYLAGREAAEIARKKIPKEKIDLAIIFSSINLASSSLLRGIRDMIGKVSIIGCTASSPISGLKIEREAVLVILISSKNNILSTSYVSEVSKKGLRQAGEELSISFLKRKDIAQRQFSLIFSDGLLERQSEILLGMQSRLGKSFPLVGGVASGNLKSQKTFQYFDENLLSDSIVGLLVSKKMEYMEYSISLRHGFRPLGKSRIITEAEANVIKTIDKRPAVSLYEEYFGKDIKRDFDYISRLYPIGIYLEEEKNYLLRSVLRASEDGNLVFQTDIPKDTKIRLMIGTKESLLEAARLAAEEAKRAIQRVSLVLIFNSISRKMILGREAEREIEIIKKVFGNTPLAGFYAYGEKAPLKSLEFKGQSYLHNHSITILAIGE